MQNPIPSAVRQWIYVLAILVSIASPAVAESFRLNGLQEYIQLLNQVTSAVALFAAAIASSYISSNWLQGDYTPKRALTEDEVDTTE